MAKRKIIKNENVEAINEIEKVEVANVNEETVIEKEEITETPKIEVEKATTEKVDDTNEMVKEETFELVDEKPLINKSIKNKKPIMFGYIWNGQEYD